MNPLDRAGRIVADFSSNLRMKNRFLEPYIIPLAQAIDDLGLENNFPAVTRLHKRLERDPTDVEVAKSLARRLRKIIEHYTIEDKSPFLHRPAPGEVDGPIRTARTYNGGFFGRQPIEATEHQLIVGRSGVGKTNIQLQEFDMINRLGGRCIVFTVKTTFRRFINRFPTLVIRCGAPDDQFRSNPFETPPGMDNTQARNLIVRALAEAQDMYVGSQNYIAENLAALQNEKYKISPDNHPTFRDLLMRIKNEKPQYSKDPRRVGYRGSTLDRFQPIYDSMHTQFDCVKGYPLEEIGKHYNIIVEGHRLDPFGRHFEFCSKINRFLSSIAAANPSHTMLRHSVIIEEGDSLFNIKMAQIRDPLLFGYFRLVRELGVGFCIDTQTPAMLDPRVFSNTYTKILMGLTDGIQIHRCVDSWGFEDDKQVERIYSLGVGEAIVRFGRYPHLFEIKTDKYNLDETVTEEDVIINNRNILKEFDYVALRSNTIEVGDGAPKTETQQETGKTPNTIEPKVQLIGDDKKLFHSIVEEPYKPFTSRCKSSNFSGWRRDKAKNSLIQKGLVAEYPVKLGRKRGEQGKILALLNKSELVMQETHKIKSGRGAGLEHSSMQRLLKSHFQNLYSVKAQTEAYRNGKCADLSLTKNDGSVIAVEYEMKTSLYHVAENIRKDLDAGFDKVITICSWENTLKKVKEIVEKEFSAREKERISIYLLCDVLMGRPPSMVSITNPLR